MTENWAPQLYYTSIIGPSIIGQQATYGKLRTATNWQDVLLPATWMWSGNSGGSSKEYDILSKYHIQENAGKVYGGVP